MFKIFKFLIIQNSKYENLSICKLENNKFEYSKIFIQKMRSEFVLPHKVI